MLFLWRGWCFTLLFPWKSVSYFFLDHHHQTLFLLQCHLLLFLPLYSPFLCPAVINSSLLFAFFSLQCLLRVCFDADVIWDSLYDTSFLSKNDLFLVHNKQRRWVNVSFLCFLWISLSFAQNCCREEVSSRKDSGTSTLKAKERTLSSLVLRHHHSILSFLLRLLPLLPLVDKDGGHLSSLISLGLYWTHIRTRGTLNVREWSKREMTASCTRWWWLVCKRTAIQTTRASTEK